MVFYGAVAAVISGVGIQLIITCVNEGVSPVSLLFVR